MKSSFVQVNTSKIHYLTAGGGMTLVLLPSLWVTSESYIFLGSELSKNFKVIIPDIYRGESVFDKNTKNIDDYVESLYDFIKALSIDKFYLVGISFSGLVATQYAFQHAKSINRLFLVSTTAVPLLIKNKKLILIFGYAKLLYHNMFSGDGIKTNLLWLNDSIKNLIRHPKQVIYEGFLATSNYDDNITDMKVPTKLIFAKKDEFIPTETLTETLIKMKKITNLEVEVVDHYHAWFFRHEDELAKRVVDFF
ncbi:MAG: alpha/beta hydrolase fold protein [Parcubacteria group bacterium GW2011_GWA2_46_7]|nr:MAG: alpha/beta hydrolase fold protein [Parcubacteria group bacterium GW2011_GWF1_45_5]KKU43933.1 MAG: alpha/beta hydrolase fold protein [Parcubacteria group bacterium GW2011_GWA2_46_7]KKU47496.1 MAG: alpha/beta hydrolase fold protein [Parcubacteria group bacterium GW2011_GWF2_46_8]